MACSMPVPDCDKCSECFVFPLELKLADDTKSAKLADFVKNWNDTSKKISSKTGKKVKKLTDALNVSTEWSIANIKEYKRIIDLTLMKIDPAEKELADTKIQQIADGMQMLQKKGSIKYSQSDVNLVKLVVKKYAQVHKKLKELEFEELPKIISKIATYQGLGATCGPNIKERAKDIGAGCIVFGLERKRMYRDMDKLKECFDDLFDINGNLVKSKESQNLSKNKNERSSMKKSNLARINSEDKDNICGSVHDTQFCEKCGFHNIPFCRNCGWQSSWINNFKKRGIHVKAGFGHNRKDIWQNIVKKD